MNVDHLTVDEIIDQVVMPRLRDERRRSITLLLSKDVDHDTLEHELANLDRWHAEFIAELRATITKARSIDVRH